PTSPIDPTAATGSRVPLSFLIAVTSWPRRSNPVPCVTTFSSTPNGEGQTHEEILLPVQMAILGSDQP
ncbi:MAG TPA: hypothetical protein VMU77_02520, partial [Acidimicrobiales bacterium]|nr:hypothetical protein [Acidimicrobiales bacterium]